MKKRSAVIFGLPAVVLAFSLVLAGCDDPNKESSSPPPVVPSTLSGTITISPNSNVTTGDTLSAVYSGNETGLSYQWQKDNANVPTDGNSPVYIPATAGSYRVIVSKAGYESKTSGTVTVTGTAITNTLTGTVAIKKGSDVVTTANTGDTLTASYSGGQETDLTYQWKKDGTNVGTGITYTPATAGIYTVIVGKANYVGKSATVTVNNRELAGTVKIQKNNVDVTTANTGDTLSAVYSVSTETGLSYQWKKDGANIPTGGTSQTYTPTAAGSYTVTVSKTGYDSKTSNAVNVTGGGVPAPSQVATPTASPAAGAVDSGTQITLSTTTAGATIYYTLDNSTPTTASNTYNASAKPTITVAVTIKAIAVKEGMTNSTMLTAAYTVTAPSGPTWTAVGNTGGDYGPPINGIAWNGTHFVTVDNSSGLSYSTDGTTWTGATKSSSWGTNFSLFGVAYGNSKWVAVGQSGKIATVANASYTWGNLTHSLSFYSIYAIAYGNNRFVAAGQYGKMATSLDGTTWNMKTSQFGTAQMNSAIYGIAWNGTNKFVAVGSYGQMATSSDGETWATATTAASAIFGSTPSDIIYGIAWGGGSVNKWVAVGTNGKMATSENGETWTQVNDSKFGSTAIRGIAWGGNKFVAVGENGKMAYSTNGTDWTAIIPGTGPGTGQFSTSSNIYGITYGGTGGSEKFIAVGNYGKIAYWDGTVE